MSEAVQDILDQYATTSSGEERATEFREYRRWTGDEPRLLVAEVAASTTGQQFISGVKPAVERFQATFVETDRVDSFDSLAALEIDDEDLREVFTVRRNRTVLLEAARVLAERPEEGDLESLVGWASSADHYRYDSDPIGSISGVGPSSFQYLRQLAGVETIRPTSTVTTLIESVIAELDSAPLDTSTTARTIASGEWLSFVSSYSPLEIDRLAWCAFTDEETKRATAAVHETTEKPE
ncbi:hypothetical protein SAMN04487967_0606 [Natronorubrum sediminis]|uniref:Uncharacterized protein n=1 Tax=Natronorubrum sediminis TaxID=640943 RepID=A0A1H6FQH3_9EURY|nr:hypothetical protein [Natronorubrum sediminis]SEH11994.1 hypothetical protein SAMN04487967_0606 [Natronorubrum sediminis]